MSQNVTSSRAGNLATIIAAAFLIVLPFQNCAKELPGESQSSQNSQAPANGFKAKYFIGSSKQTAVLRTIGTMWTDIPGTAITFHLSQPMAVDMKGHGSASFVAGTNYPSSTHCGFRFVVDGLPFGNATWGDVIIQVTNWQHWGITRQVDLPAGDHVIKLQQTGWNGADSACNTNEQDYSAARLHLEAF